MGVNYKCSDWLSSHLANANELLWVFSTNGCRTSIERRLLTGRSVLCIIVDIFGKPLNYLSSN
jgi:hypothetical protein